MSRQPKVLVPIILVLLLAFAHSHPAALAQLQTPVASPAARPLGTPEAASQVDLSGITPLPLTEMRRAEFEANVADALLRYGVPGASVAVVQGGEVVYAQGFGVTEVGGTKQVTADTLMAIGSTTKAMSSMMAATVVDDDLMSWQTPIVDLLPAFAVADPELTPRLTVADAFCACTGVPTRTRELIFTFDTLTPERLIASVADFPLTAPYGEQFQYSNQMYSVGGWAATIAAGGAPNALAEGYRLAMGDRILGPIGMTRSTFALDEVLASGDYAHPHGAGLDGQIRPLSLLADARFAAAAGPAGGLWSSAHDMARYVQTQLANGIAPGGTRVVSAENLARTRTPGVAIPPVPALPTLMNEGMQHYALGWQVGAYKGQPLINHSGGTLGFVSEVAFLPEADLGVVILTNGGPGAGPFVFAVQYRLFELLFNQPSEFDALAGQLLEAHASSVAELRAHSGPVDPAVVAPYDGRYANPVLGEVVLELRDDRLVFETGELRSELRAQVDEAQQVIGYVFADAPLASVALAVVTLQPGSDGRPEVMLTGQGEAAQTYIFTRLGESAAATPTP